MGSKKGDGKKTVVRLAMGHPDVKKYLTEEDVERIYDDHKGMKYQTLFKLYDATAMVRKYEKAAKRP